METRTQRFTWGTQLMTPQLVKVKKARAKEMNFDMPDRSVEGSEKHPGNK